jgi:hypothetical protein
VSIVALWGSTIASAAPAPLSLSVSGANGVGRIERPGISCADGGDGASWHYEYGAPIVGGVFSSLTGTAGLHLNLHSQAQGAPQATYNKAWLPPGQSYVTIGNYRGVIRLGLVGGGTCAAPTLNFDGTTASGAGTWSLTQGSGAYRQATGSGTFALASAAVAPGADNPFNLSLTGSVSILLPSLKADVVSTYWGFGGIDYLSRIVTVVFRITNNGPGDAFGVRLTKVTSPTDGVTVLGPVPWKLGDLLNGESELVRIKYQFALLKPCSAVILSCEFDSTLSVEMPDALDRIATYTSTKHATAPAFPPPA